MLQHRKQSSDVQRVERYEHAPWRPERDQLGRHVEVLGVSKPEIFLVEPAVGGGVQIPHRKDERLDREAFHVDLIAVEAERGVLHHVRGAGRETILQPG